MKKVMKINLPLMKRQCILRKRLFVGVRHAVSPQHPQGAPQFHHKRASRHVLLGIPDRAHQLLHFFVPGEPDFDKQKFPTNLQKSNFGNKKRYSKSEEISAPEIDCRPEHFFRFQSFSAKVRGQTKSNRRPLYKKLFLYSAKLKSADFKKSECVICLSAIEKPKQARRTPCAHLFHSKCILKWAKKKMSCPCCRLDLRRMKKVVLPEAFNFPERLFGEN